MTDRAFVLHSGGVDSTTVLAQAAATYGVENVVSISIFYWQRHAKELEYAARFCRSRGIAHQTLSANEPTKSTLTDPNAEIPDVSYDQIQGISPTYVPFRNGQFLARVAAIAQAWTMEDPAGERGATVWFGAHLEDAHNWAYPDCTSEFINAMGTAIYVGTYYKVGLVAPFQLLKKAEIVRAGHAMGVDFSLTWSCYKGGEKHCGTCPTCRARKQAFIAAGIDDPTDYEQ